MAPEVLSALEKIGLTGSRLSVFLALLSSEPLHATSVAKASRVNRTTVYGILRDLQQMGLVSSIKKAGATTFQSIAPEAIPGYIERRIEELSLSKRAISDALPMLRQLRERRSGVPRVRFFEGMGGVEQAYEDMLIHNASKRILAFTGLEGAMKRLRPEFLAYFINKRVELGIEAAYIVPSTPAAREATIDDASKKRIAKFIPGVFNFNTEVCVYDDKVSILSYALEHPVALIIQDATIAHTMRQLFSFVDSKATYESR